MLKRMTLSGMLAACVALAFLAGQATVASAHHRPAGPQGSSIVQSTWWQRRACAFDEGVSTNCLNVHPHTWKGLVYRYQTPDRRFQCRLYAAKIVAKQYDHCWLTRH